MIPSSRWFPLGLQEQAAWMNNFKTNIQGVGASLGMTAPEITSVGQDADVLDFLATTSVAVGAYTDAIRAYRKTITEGDIGDPTPVFPSDVTFSLPSPIDTGLFERLSELVARIRAAPAYTEEIGAQLGILTGGGVIVPVGAVPPVLTAEVDPGNIVAVKFIRGRSDGVTVECNCDAEGWASKGRFMNSPITLNITASTAGTPRGVQIRARYMDGDAAVGDWSDIITVQTIP